MMERVFRDYLRTSLKTWIKENFQFLKLSKLKLGAPFEGALIWESAGEHGATAYLILRFHSNRHYVTLDIAWERTGLAPNYDLSVETSEEFYRCRKLPGIDDPLAKVIAEREHGWAVGAHTCSVSSFDMSGKTPPETRLCELFEGEATRVPVREALFAPDDHTDWRKAKLWHSWEMLGAFLTSTMADAEYALGGTLAEITKALTKSYSPYLEQCRNKE